MPRPTRKTTARAAGARIRANVLTLRRQRRLVELYAVAALVVVAATLFLYTHLVISRLRHEFEVSSRSYAAVMTLLGSNLADAEMEPVIVDLAGDIGKTMKFPSVVTDAAGVPQAWSRHYGPPPEGPSPPDLAAIRAGAAALDRRHEPLAIYSWNRDAATGRFGSVLLGHFHYGEPMSIRLMYWVPALQLVLILAFAAAGYFSYRRLRSAEQQLLWAGMARETAHQLGTPITSLIGWLEHAREQAGRSRALGTTLAEMTEDVARLEKVAARFQEIGVPVKPVRADVVPLVERAVAYGRRRAPAKTGLAFEAKTPARLVFPHSPVLVEWVIENLVKNAVDATKDLPAGKGRIVVAAREEGRWAAVAVSDNGVGVGADDQNFIFAPGYTTKDKGWGLGLSLVKRIVEEVHGGRLEVWSEPGAGATFTAYFPKG